MEAIAIVALIAVAALMLMNKQKSGSVSSDDNFKKDERLPYRVGDSILTKSEMNFYHSLKLNVGDKAIICPKVGLKDLFYVSKSARKEYMKYFGKIAQKHVDFVLCDPASMKPICGIELDDESHTSKKSYARDLFVEKVYKDADFYLVRLSSKSGYSQNEITEALKGVFSEASKIQEPKISVACINQVADGISDPIEDSLIHAQTNEKQCPKCGGAMVMRKSTKDSNVGKAFYGCSNFPNCRETVAAE
jgi:ssDNA-binding Zn-finger/Zn-ribbon topoisomerase 1